LLFAVIASFTGVILVSRTTTQERVSSLARVIGTNCVAALAFDDPEAARETLKALTAEPQIATAAVYKPDGALFAEYRSANHPGVEPARTAHLVDMHRLQSISIHHRFQDSALYVNEPIFFDGKIIGIVEISSDLKELHNRLIMAAATFIAILLLSFLVAYVVSTRAQRTISDPITTLIQTMKTVSREKDYAIRVQTRSQDELANLFHGFNNMLSEIQARDEKLHFTQFSMDHMGDAALWMEEDGRIVNANHAACRSLGYLHSDLTDMNISDIDPGLTGTRWRDLWDKVRRRRAITFESAHLNKEGKFFPVEFSANFLEYQGKSYLCAFSRNIADRKALQLQLEQAQKMEAIGTLAGGVAHDLNNILGGLVGYPDLLLMELPDDSPLRKPLTAVKRSGEKAAAIVQDMLTLARRGVDLRSAVNLNEIVAEYLKSPEHEKIIQFHRGLRFEILLDQNLPNVIGSEIHLSKTLMNLVSNAAEATTGKGMIVIRTFYGRLNTPMKGFQTIPEGDYAVLSIEDEGTGMSEKDMVNIFEPFYTKKKMGRSGTGLGMSVVSGTVKDHKGFIDLKSKEGQGTRFDLYFPITYTALQEKENNFAPYEVMGNENILVIDDVKEQREFACIVLEKLGYHVGAVSSGEEALIWIQTKKADLLVLDMIMEPGIDGLETYRHILKLYPGQKAVVASGFAENDRVRQILDLGAGAYVRKPYTLEKLGTAVRTVLDRRER
jgi:two-component system, cell cycle sensor histidine kinase and response regulator CckA